MNTRHPILKSRTLVAILLVVFVSFTGGSKSDVIYGADSRQNYSDLGSPLWKNLSRSSATMVYKRRLVSTATGKVRIKGKPLQAAKNLCAEERFKNEPVIADCSGFLISSDVVVTAGHCLKQIDDCKKISWVFELNDTKIIDRETVEFPSHLVYSCSSVLKFDPKLDVAIMRLDRKVTGREPLARSNSTRVDVGTRVAIMGNPSKIPTKISLGGRVTESSANDFLAEVSSADGSSGSAVIDETTHNVLGFLVAGEEDWVYDRAERCYRSKICKPNQCSGETIVKLSKALRGTGL